MIKILASHPKVNDNELTHLADAYTSGTSLTVRDSSTFAVNDYIIVGTLGSEKTEISKVSAIPTATTLTISALSNTHPTDTPVNVIDWNQVEFSYSTDNSTWTVLATSGINADQENTTYNHTAGLSTYYYRYRYYNATTLGFSGYSDTIGGSGYGSTSLYAMRKLVRDITNEPDDQFISDDYIDSLINNAQTEVAAYYKKWRFLQERPAAVTASIVSRDYIALPTDYDHSMQIVYNFNDGTTNIKYPLVEITWLEMLAKKEDQSADNSDYIYYFSIDPETSRIYFENKNSSILCSFEIMYYKKFTALDSDGDTTVVPMPMVLVTYAVAYVRATRLNEPVNKNDYRAILRDMLKHEKITMSEATGLRNPVEGMGLYFKVGR